MSTITIPAAKLRGGDFLHTNGASVEVIVRSISRPKITNRDSAHYGHPDITAAPTQVQVGLATGARLTLEPDEACEVTPGRFRTTFSTAA